MKQLYRGLLIFLTTLARCAGARLPPATASVPTLSPGPAAARQGGAQAAATAPSAPKVTVVPVRTVAPSETQPPGETSQPSVTPTFEPLIPTPTLAPLDEAQRTAIFEEVWSIVRDNYVYEDYRGVDWEAARDEFAPRIAAAGDPEIFYVLMRELISRLGDEHSRFESPQQVFEQQAESRGDLRYSGIGAQIRAVEDGGLLVNLVPGGPGERAGLRQRDIILRVNGIPFTDTAAFGPDGPIGAVRGEPGTPVMLTVRSGTEAPRELAVIREPVDLDLFNQVRARTLPGGAVGVIEIPSFYVEGVDVEVRKAVEGLLAAGTLRGLVLDVRENTGGYVHLMRDTIALFHDGGSIGSTRGRSINEDQAIPTGKTVPGVAGLPVSILVGPDSASAAEMFAAGMQVLGRARIVGVPSAGNTENLYSYSFDDGSRLLVAQVAYRLPDGTLIEGRGVVPDRYVNVEWWRYAPDADPQLLAAVEELGLAPMGHAGP
ncbi:MAG: PDZ domain-containing protein [Chloroflexales bacterium]|nr:PDZ domain-containing protein [Chloroflexales bacterium]